MPTDNVKNRTFRDLFRNNVRFEIPFFQRGYAWGRRQWDQLFQDLQEEVLPDLEIESLDQIEHFFGPIVVQERTGHEDLKEYLVIDGQQRITTIYLLLGLVFQRLRRLTMQSQDAIDHCTALNRFLANDVSAGDDYLRLKVFSTKGDRLPTYRTVFGDDYNPSSAYFAADNQLYQPGHNRVDEFREYAEKKLKTMCRTVPDLWQFAQVLLDCLKVVWIPLDENKDDAQAIFESLNDKGMPLTSSELLCNFLFKALARDEDFERLHNDQWLAAMKVLRERDAFEEYLRNLFSIGENKTVGKGRRVYVHFKNKYRSGLGKAMARHVLGEIHDGAKLYRYIIDPTEARHPNPKIHKLLVDIAQTRMSSSTPFVLSVLLANSAGSLSDFDAEAILRETLVLLVRRKMTEQPTTVYDTMFPGLLGRIINEPNRIRALHEQFKKNSVWVSNQEFEEAMIFRTLYRSRDLAFARMMLVEIDKSLQAHGQLPDYSTVPSIEHMIPQSLDDAWRSYLGDEAADEHLQTVIHTIGNLCLLSGPANSAAGRNAFEAKQIAYSPITALARQIADHDGAWNIAAVRSRSKTLAQAAQSVWAWSEAG